jgi:hypothetical protein
MMADGVEADMTFRDAMTLEIRRREMVVVGREDRSSIVVSDTQATQVVMLVVNTSRWQVQQHEPGLGRSTLQTPSLCVLYKKTDEQRKQEMATSAPRVPAVHGHKPPQWLI